MAESFEPVLGPRIARGKYDWDLWFARPFKAWVLLFGVDFFISPVQMQKTVHQAAAKYGLRVSASCVDPHDRGSVWFCAFADGEDRPRPWANASATFTEAPPEELSYDTYECEICGAVREIIPWFGQWQEDGTFEQFVKECIGSNVGEYAATHRDDTPLPVFTSAGAVITYDWSKESGPIAKGPEANDRSELIN